MSMIVECIRDDWESVRCLPARMFGAVLPEKGDRFQATGRFDCVGCGARIYLDHGDLHYPADFFAPLREGAEIERLRAIAAAPAPLPEPAEPEPARI